MAILPLAQDIHGAPYIANVDSGGNLAVPTEQYIKSGGLYVPISAANPLPTSITGSLANDALVPSGSSIAQTPVLFNETNWDRQRGNTQGTLLASAARTALTASPIQTNYNARGIALYLNVTAASGTGGLGIDIMLRDPVSGADLRINATPTLVTTTGLKIYQYYPGIITTNSTLAQAVPIALPRTWYALVEAGDATSYTYSLGFGYIL